MTVTPEKVAEILALPASDRAYLALNLLESLDTESDPDAETLWAAELDRRCREIDEGLVVCESVEDGLKAIRKELDAKRLSS